ncbi:hypothetical protein RI129_005119 [Pyrocoelia pectoralis]|uniref:Uncharacterized protein n=1 Tax=Pyrocoelia pectoralis TaxID=417401 RepID=A0AAN7ZH96_9COLE
MMELLMADFWCPLQAKFVAFVATIPDYVNNAMNTLGVDIRSATDYLEVLKSEEALIASSYLLSAFFLLSTLHACRVSSSGNSSTALLEQERPRQFPHNALHLRLFFLQVHRPLHSDLQLQLDSCMTWSGAGFWSVITAL